ncbi:butyrophilin subfamily 3 member A1-like [Heterodontus francisci]|uniref:butyrophilin subfamily 3 member A1-like n=1 Tax=Heterodontus francisci TaxID=7792 RepID=UPI00355B3391
MKEIHHIVLLLLVILVSVYGQFHVFGPDHPVVAIVGEDALLECQLVPDLFISNMVVQWLKSGLDSPVHVYRNGEDDIVVQHKNYRGRTELIREELTKGTISLRIKNTTVSDEGEYTCLVDDRTDSAEAAVTLEVVGLGRKPWIQMKQYHNNGIQLVCKSSGWYPEPEILWMSEDGDNLIQAETRYQQDSNGLGDVQSNIEITKQSTNRFRCLIWSEQLKTEQEAIIRISGDIFPVDPAWPVPLLVTLCLLIAALSAVIYWNVKQYRRIKELELRKSIVAFEWKRICDCEVSVTLDVETANPELEVSEDLKSVRNTGTWRSLPDTEKRFTDWSCRCVLGSEGFTSGRHYWEVEVEGNRDWNLGVAAESVNRKDYVDRSLENGFWTIERVWDQFNINSSPRSHLPDDQIPGKVGIYLSYESGTVSFYDADTKSHLHTFTGNKFSEKLYPFFQTWDLNKWLRICSEASGLSHHQ